jgi:hypothetical protein
MMGPEPENIMSQTERAPTLAAFNRLMAEAEPMAKGGVRAVPGEGPPDAAGREGGG